MHSDRGGLYGVDSSLIDKKLTKLLNDKNIPTLRISDNKYSILSDCHLGDGGSSDNFRNNENCLVSALNYYYDNDYTLILLGDFEELWQFSLNEIINRYDRTIYAAIRKFQDDKTKTRVYRVFGNHDIDWKFPADPILTPKKTGGALEALKMNMDGDENQKARILLLHGNQGTTDSDKNLTVSRAFVKLYRSIEPIAEVMGVDVNPSLPQCEITKDYEKKYYNWAKQNKVIVICGHTHRAIFASTTYINKLQNQILQIREHMKNNRGNSKLIEQDAKKLEELGKKILEETFKRGNVDISSGGRLLPVYFNTGCGIYKEGITVIEIGSDTIRLMKWNKDCQREDPPYGVHNLSEYISQIA